MVAVLAIVAWTLTITLIGGGGFYFIWLKTRPLKETWKAKIYQLGEGIRSCKNHDSLNLQDLRPYAMDILEKVETGPGKVDVYFLQRLRKTTPAVTSDLVDYWGMKNKEVHVLVQESGCTLLKKGFDKKSGEIIFHPISHDQISMIENQRAIKKERLQNKKDVLVAMTPWIVAGIAIIGLIPLGYIMITGFIEISEHLDDAMKSVAQTHQTTLDYNIKVAELKQGVEIIPTTPGIKPTGNNTN